MDKKDYHVFAITMQSVCVLSAVVILWINRHVAHIGGLFVTLGGMVLVCTALMGVLLRWVRWNRFSRLGCSLLFAIQTNVVMPLWNNEGVWNFGLPNGHHPSLMLVLLYTAGFYLVPLRRVERELQ